MNIVDRVKNILLTPKTEWDVIAAEPANRQQLIVHYVLILAAIPAVIGFLLTLALSSFFGGFGVLYAVFGLVWSIAWSIASVFLFALVVDGLAPSFGAQKNYEQALKVVAYSYTPVWIGSVVAVIPLLGWLVLLAAVGYSVYILYLGLMQVMRSPQDKAVGYTAVTIIIAIVVAIVVGSIVAVIQGAAMFGAAGAAGAFGKRVDTSTPYSRDSTVGKLDDFAKKMEAAGKKMEAAQASGDQNAQAQAALEALGTAVSGGRKVEALSVEEVKAFVPETFAGLPRTSQSAERSGMASLMVTTAKATYGDNSGKQVRLEVTDAGGAGAMMGLASWMGAMNTEREDDNGAERTRKEGNRLVHERVSKRGGDNEYSVVVGERFIVKASGTVDLSGLKGGVSNVNLAKLESMKDVGVAKN
jgi:hypothetical protein